MRRLFFCFALLLLTTVGCVRNQPDIIVITATFQAAVNENPSLALTTVPPIQQTLFPPGAPEGTPTPDPTREIAMAAGGEEYVVQPGDTLSGIANTIGVSIETLLQANPLADPNTLEVGQVLMLPAAPSQFTTDFKIVPDGKLVRGPGSSSFDVAAFISQQPGYIRGASDLVDDVPLSATDIVKRISLEYSVDARLLLALLEYKGKWLSNPNPTDDIKNYPMSAPDAPGFSRSGLYRQLAYTADQLNAGYYGWKGRGLTTVELTDGTRMLYSPGLNAGTVGVQYLFSLFSPYTVWQQQVSPEGFYATYNAYFGNPFAGAIEPLVPSNLEQPALTFPFPQGQTWYFTGGPHGGWASGSAWAAVDFAPPDDMTGCYVSQYYATALAPGVIARTDEGTVILDLDGDGDESTGWIVFYMHMAAEGRIAVGTHVEIGDNIGRPSCEGGFSNGTHMHIARRYNGEWIPAYCDQCPPGQERPAFEFSGWSVVGYPGQEYQGYMVKGGEQRFAEQGRLNDRNNVAW
jgi:LasA protease